MRAKLTKASSGEVGTPSPKDKRSSPKKKRKVDDDDEDITGPDDAAPNTPPRKLPGRKATRIISFKEEDFEDEDKAVDIEA